MRQQAADVCCNEHTGSGYPMTLSRNESGLCRKGVAGNCRHVPTLVKTFETSFGANRMKAKVVALSAAVLLMGTVLSFAQSASISIEPEQRTRIKEYVVKERVPRVVVKERYRVGAQVPADVELRDAPDDWGPSVRRYRYYHTEHGVHLVDPESRRVMYDVDD
jgi:hypothetical protein